MRETQVLMTISDFGVFFPRNHFLEGGFIFQWGEGRGFEKNHGIRVPPHLPSPQLWETLLFTLILPIWKETKCIKLKQMK